MKMICSQKLLFVFLYSILLVSSKAQQPYSVDLFFPSASSQELQTANEEYLRMKLRGNPNLINARAAYEHQLQFFLQNTKLNSQGQSLITIPVVIHNVYNTPAEYVTDAQVYSQLVVLNEDFIRAAADTVNTPVPFRLLAGNPQIQFCLAQRDPQGNPTTGIERRQTTIAQWGFDDAVKFTSQGGMDIWDPTRYFNIWICNTGGTSWGEFPTGTVTTTYGAVMHYPMFGSNFTQYGTFPNISAYYDRGEIMCHEVGHCLNLRHIWGDDNTACTGSDTCADTPNQGGPSSFCPTFPLFDACTPSGDGIMFNNFMDYSDDDCYNMFTLGQVARMNAVLSTPPYNALASSNACVPVTLFPNDASILSIETPNAVWCNGTLSPVVELKNWGATPLNSCVITSQIDANPPQTYNWFGNIPSLGSNLVTLNPVSVSAGMHTFTASSSQPNGFADGQPANDMGQTVFTAYAGGQSLPYSQGFEPTTFVPANWILNNPDNADTWQRTTTASMSGAASAKLVNIFYNDIGQWDEMQMMPVDFTSMQNPALSFQVAYTYYIFSNPPNPPLNFTDTLTVYISTDCGQTFTPIFNKGGAQLSTATPIPNSGTEYVPAPGDWRLETINLSAYQNIPDAIIKFRNTTGWGNSVYLDDINLFSTTGMEENEMMGQITISPNPSNGLVKVGNLSGDASVLSITDLSGRILQVITLAGQNEIILDLSAFDSGVYLLQLRSKIEKAVSRLVMIK